MPRSPSTSRCPTSGSSPRRYPVAQITASGSIRTPSASSTQVEPSEVTAVTTSIRPSLIASITSPSTIRSEEHTSELQSHRDLHSFPTRRSSDPHAVGELDPGRAERGDRRDDLDPALLDRLDHLAVDDRGHLAPFPNVGKDPGLRPAQPVFGQVTEVHPRGKARDSIGEPGRQVPEPSGDQVARDRAGSLAQQDVGWRAYREPDLSGTALRQLVGDLHSGAPGSDHDDTLALEWPRVPVLARVDQLPLEVLAAGPVGHDGAPIEPGGHD